MALTVQQVDAKIEEAKKTLDFWVKAREVVANPLFAELSSAVPAGRMTPPPDRVFVMQSGEAIPIYGALKRRTLDSLSYQTPMTPQQLADALAKGGYVFRTKTPAISVNDALQTLQVEGKAKFVGRGASNAGLWVRVQEKKEDSQQEEGATEVTPT